MKKRTGKYVECANCRKEVYRQKNLLLRKNSVLNTTSFHYCGKECMAEHYKKIYKGVKRPGTFKKGSVPSLKGKKHTEATKKKMRENHRGMTGMKLSANHRRKLSELKKGERSYLWKGGTSPENKRIRNGIDFRLWREAVFARDNWTCQKTKERGGKLHPHHIKNFADYPELRFAIDNGITLSEKSHKEFHKKYRYKNDDKQIAEFLL